MSSARQITIGLTCVGGHYLYDIIRALKSVDDFQATIIGMDADPDSKGQWLVDSFETVPMIRDGREGYCERVAYLCAQYNVDVLILGSETETKAIANHSQFFSSCRAKTTADNREAADIVTDKLKFFNFLRQHSIDVGAYLSVNSVQDVRGALTNLGYPKKNVVFKPRHGTGSRSVFIADARKKYFEHLLETRFCGTGSIEAIISEMEKRNETFNNCVAMPYYGTQVFDVDCLAVKGEGVNIVPRLRQYKNPLSPVNEGCRVVMDDTLILYAQQIARVLRVHGACDFDIALDDRGKPKVLDASLRMSGSVGAAFAAGANLPAQLVRILLGFPLKKYTVKDGAVLRPVNHIIAV